MKVLGTARRAAAVLHVFTLAASLLFVAAVRADEVQVAVAGNFAATLTLLAERFQKVSGHIVVASSGASGALFAQVENGAPFDIFLSADAERPLALEQAGLAVPGTRFVYAEGRLLLWSPEKGRVDAEGAALSKPDLKHVAIADPRTAPYGAAAERVLRARGLWDRLNAEGKIALGTSITQAHQFVASGNAELGFVALSQVRGPDGAIAGSHWLVPKALAGPIRQEAVLLKRADKNAAARAFLAFLRGDASARRLIARAGYEIPSKR